jgi:hypothetical protein
LNHREDRWIIASVASLALFLTLFAASHLRFSFTAGEIGKPNHVVVVGDELARVQLIRANPNNQSMSVNRAHELNWTARLERVPIPSGVIAIAALAETLTPFIAYFILSSLLLPVLMKRSARDLSDWEAVACREAMRIVAATVLIIHPVIWMLLIAIRSLGEYALPYWIGVSSISGFIGWIHFLILMVAPSFLTWRLALKGDPGGIAVGSHLWVYIGSVFAFVFSSLCAQSIGIGLFVLWD